MAQMVEHSLKTIVIRSYTAWAFYILAILTVAPDLIYKVFEIDTNPVVWGRLQLLTIVFGFVGRMLLQRDETKKIRAAIILVIVIVVSALSIPALAQSQQQDACDQSFESIAFNLVSRWEGTKKVGSWNVSYLDTIAKPPLWTVCYGHTKTAGPGQRKTDAECKEMLVVEIEEYRDGLHVYFTSRTKRLYLTNHRDAAYTSFAYNVGVRAAGRSTATRRLNAGDIEGGCDALTWWNKAGGRVVRGLTRRRSDEKLICLK